MVPNVTIALNDGVKIVAQDTPHQITPYVLREQGDWFEDEIKFLRRVIEPGWRAVDIGANHGVYALVIAKLAGQAGHVWAFEPASSTAARLAAGIAANGFANVTLEECAVSEFPGTARLSLHENSELNKLADDTAAEAAEEVAVVSLDQSALRHQWKAIDFLKIDAEGQEMNIIRGGTGFLASESPLIMYEIKSNAGFHLDLAQAFAERGYRSYRLVPGLDVLVPFDATEKPDGYLLNLFCCKPDRAAALAARGLLIDGAEIDDGREHPSADYEWWATLAKHPYGAILRAEWERAATEGRGAAVASSLVLYARSQDSSRPAAERFAALRASFQDFQRQAAEPTAFLRASSLARVAREYGAREIAVKALRQLCIAIFQRRQVDPAEPFLAPGRRSEGRPIPDPKMFDAWLAVAALEELEHNQFYSSYYSGKAELGRLEFICNSGFGDDEMKRRRELIQQRFGI